jgi:hypothetical protein
MQDQDKTKDQLIDELKELRREITQMDASKGKLPKFQDVIDH